MSGGFVQQMFTKKLLLSQLVRVYDSPPTHPPHPTHESSRVPPPPTFNVNHVRSPNTLPLLTFGCSVEQERVRWRWQHRRSGDSDDSGAGSSTSSGRVGTNASDAVAHGLMRFLDAHLHLLPGGATERTSEQMSFSGGGEKERRRRHRGYCTEMHDPALGGAYPYSTHDSKPLDS